MEFLNNIWQAVAPYLAGVSIGGVFTAIIYGVLKGSFAKTISKINVEKIANDAANKGIERVKEVSFKHSIQPIVNSELNKITEKANEYIAQAANKMEDKYNKIITILEKLSAYFDTSVFVNDDVKAELKEAIKVAKDKEEIVDSDIQVEEVENKETRKGKPKIER